MEKVRNGTGEAITNGDAGLDAEDDLVDAEELDRPRQIKKAEVRLTDYRPETHVCLCVNGGGLLAAVVGITFVAHL